MSRSIQDALITIGKDEAPPFERIRQALKDNSYTCVRGLFSAQEVTAAVGRIRASFDAKNDRKHDPKDAEAIRHNFQKLQIGGTRGVNSCARFLRILYNPTYEDDLYGLHEIFGRMIRFRNGLFGLRPDFTVGRTEAGKWTASRVMQYPTGGGFMAPHTDVGTSAISQEMGLEQYIQLILTMSKKGVDFHEGGAYIVNAAGTRCFIEDECDQGDIVIYDGRVLHGVEDVDPMAPLDLVTFGGRIVALVTLFKHFSQATSDQEYRALMESPPGKS